MSACGVWSLPDDIAITSLEPSYDYFGGAGSNLEITRI
jgi:hypothetical protein